MFNFSESERVELDACWLWNRQITHQKLFQLCIANICSLTTMAGYEFVIFVFFGNSIKASSTEFWFEILMRLLSSMLESLPYQFQRFITCHIHFSISIYLLLHYLVGNVDFYMTKWSLKSWSANTESLEWSSVSAKCSSRILNLNVASLVLSVWLSWKCWSGKSIITN